MRPLPRIVTRAASAAAVTVAIASVALAGITTYDVAQVTGPNGCITPLSGSCYQAPESVGISDIALGPGGGQAYAVAWGDDAVLSFSRDASTGALVEKSTADNGCINDSGNEGPGPGGCGTQAQLARPTGIVVPADGRTVHAVSINSDAIVTFTRNPSGGALSIPPAADDCLKPNGGPDGCATGHALDGLTDVVASPDGTNLYASAVNDNAVAVIARNPTTGFLSQVAGAAGCIATSGAAPSGGACNTGTAIAPNALAVSPDGGTVYAVGKTAGFGGVWAYDRGAGGELTAVSPNGCWQTSAASGCFVGNGLGGAAGIAVSPDSRHVYVASSADDAVAIFSRNTGTGGITQLGGVTGCISNDGAAGGMPGRCTDGRALDGAVGVGVTPDGRSVYVNTGGGASLAIFDRDLQTGALTQRAGTAGCITNAPASDGCAEGRELGGNDVRGNITISPDGAHVYATNAAATVFTRTTMQGLDVSVMGQGSITSSPGGIDCGADCSETVVNGTTLTLTATPADGWEFAGWTGACDGLTPGRNCSLAMIAGLSTGAVFRQIAGTPGGSASGAAPAKADPAAVNALRARWATRARTITAIITPVKGASRYAMVARGKGNARATGRCARGRGKQKGLVICRVTVRNAGAWSATVTGTGPTGTVASVTRTRRVR